MGRIIKKLFTAWKCCQGLGVLDSGEDRSGGGGGNPRQHSERSWVHIHGPPAQCTCLAPPFPLSVKNGQSNNGLCVRERMGKLGSEVEEEERPRLFRHSMGRGGRRGTQRVPSAREGQSPWLWGWGEGWGSS